MITVNLDHINPINILIEDYHPVKWPIPSLERVDKLAEGFLFASNMQPQLLEKKHPVTVFLDQLQDLYFRCVMEVTLLSNKNLLHIFPHAPPFLYFS